MYTLLPSSANAQALVTDIRRLEEAQLRAVRAEQEARRQAYTARLGLWVGLLLAIAASAGVVFAMLRVPASPPLVAGVVPLVVVYGLGDMWARFRSAQTQLTETRALLADLNARLRALKAHRA